MPSAAQITAWWQDLYFGRATADTRNLRPCGCYADALVFGHYHPVSAAWQAAAGGAP